MSDLILLYKADFGKRTLKLKGQKRKKEGKKKKNEVKRSVSSLGIQRDYIFLSFKNNW